ncbi:NmrA family NAD(P)-binding protein [Nonomuraea sp. NPDC050310]|uniref:SDR family oxidoreductase n=1 Tax=Nonomuraea sp. NPDC050310 TaxID=3154935 RepID=UPI0033E8A9D3
MTFLVTGATGRAGRHVVRQLLSEGHPVRALTRDLERAAAVLPAGAEIVRGDLTDPRTVRQALQGVVGVHLLTVGGDDYATLRTGPELAALAEEAGVARVAVLWNGQSGPVEDAFLAGSLETTLLQPTDFMGNTLGWAAAIGSRAGVSEPFGDVPIAVVHEGDVGAVSARVLADGGHGGRAYPLTGPEPLTPRQRLATIAEVVGRDLAFDELTEEQAKQRWREAGHAEELVEILAAWQGDPPAEARTVSPFVAQLTGREPRSFEQWVRDHAAHFQPAP